MFEIAFVAPQIAPNTGNAIRLAAATGCRLHVIGPLGFEMSDARLRRAGLDYHELAQVVLHHDMTAAWTAFEGRRVFAFTGGSTRSYADVRYEPGDVLMFGTERTGLSRDVLEDRRITERVRLPMLPGLRSLNLANAAAIAVYEAWRQQEFAGEAGSGADDGRFS